MIKVELIERYSATTFMPEPVPSQTLPKTEVIDAAAKHFPNLDTDDDETDLQYSLQDEEPIIQEFAADVWAAIRTAVHKEAGLLIPAFNPAMIDMAVFKDTITKGDANAISGKIRLNPNKLLTAESLADTLAHEMVHFLSQRKLLKKAGQVALIRSGLGVVAPGFGYNIETNTYHHSGGLFVILNEAIVETLSKKILNSAKEYIPGFENTDFQPTAYEEAIVFYEALQENLVLAWNKPNRRPASIHQPVRWKVQKIMMGRQWQNRFERLADELGWPATITKKDVASLFEQAMWNKHAIPYIARLVNTLLGERAFQKLGELSSKVDPSNPAITANGEKNPAYPAMWEIITAPTEMDDQAFS